MPMIIPVVIGAAATLAASVVLPATITVLGATISATLVAGIIGTVVSTVASIAMSSLLQPKAKGAMSPQVEAQDRKQTVRGGIEARQVIYGRARVGGVIVYAASSGAEQRNLNLAVVLAGHPCEEVETIILNDVEISVMDHMTGHEVTAGKYAGLADIRIHRGDQTEADGILVAESADGWDWDHKLLGCTYLGIRLIYNQDVFPSGLQSISAVIRGKNNIWDPRAGTYGFTDNWGLCVLDYLRGDHGLACLPDELNLGTMIAAANLSDESVQLNAEATEFQPRYTINGVFTLDRAPIDIIEGLLSAGAGTLTYVQGEYRLYGGSYTSPSASLDLSDFAGAIELQTRTPRRELFNSVRGTFIDPTRQWQASEFQPLSDATFVTEDGEEIWRDLQLAFTGSNYGAQRLARIALKTGRDSLRFQAPLKYAALRLAAWQMVDVTIPDLGWAAKPFRFESFRFEPATGQIFGTFREENAANYAWYFEMGAFEPDWPDTTLVDPLNIPPPTGLAVQAGTTMQADGSFLPVLDMTWAPAAHPFVTGHEVQWRFPDGGWVGQEVRMPITQHTVRAVITGVVYEVRVRGVAGLVRGPWSTTDTETGMPDTTPPAVPTGLTTVGVIRGIALRWTNPTAKDFRNVEIQESDSSGGPWTKIGETAGSFFVRSNVPPETTAWYRIRALDRSGNASAYTAAVSGTSSYLLTSDIEDGILDIAKFAASIAMVKLSFVADFSDVPAGVTFAFQTLDNRLYKRVAGTWVAVVRAEDMVGLIVADQIAANAVTFGKIAAGAVRADQIAVNELRAWHLGASEFITETAQIGNLIVGTEKITPGSMTTAYGAANYPGPVLINTPGAGAYAHAELCSLAITIASGEQGRVMVVFDDNVGAAGGLSLTTYTETGGGGDGGGGGGGGE